MKTLSRFVAKFTSLIVGVLSCFDRVIFKGYLPLTNGPALEGFVDHVLRIRRKDFMAFAEDSPRPWSIPPNAWPRRPVPSITTSRARTAKTGSSTRFCDSDRSAMGYTLRGHE